MSAKAAFSPLERVISESTGSSCARAAAASIDVIDPATEERIGEIAEAPPAEDRPSGRGGEYGAARLAQGQSPSARGAAARGGEARDRGPRRWSPRC